MRYFLILLISLPLILAAQSHNLDDMINHGLEHSFQMQKSQINLQSSQSSFRSSKWGLLPELRVYAGMDQDFTDNTAPASATTSNAGFSVSKSISLNDPAYYQYRFAKLDRNTSELDFSESRRAYVFDVFRAYIEVLSAQKRLASLTENMNIQTRVWEQSKVLQQLGKNTGFDVKQSEIALMNSRISILQLENTIESARQSLFNLVQMHDDGAELEDLVYEAGILLPELDLERVDQIKILKQSLSRTQLSMSQARWDLFPSLSLSYNFNRRVSGEDFDFNRYSTVHGVSLNLSYSLWSPFREKENFSRLKLSKQIAEINLSSAESTISTRYEQLSRQLNYQVRLDELYREKLLQSQEQIRIAEERYRLGLIDILELDKTRTEYIDADIAYNANQYQMIQSREELNYLLSMPVLGSW